MAEVSCNKITSARKSYENLAESVTNMTRAGYTNISLALGSILGLFDILSEFDSPKTYQEIAKVGNFDERYVYEWLGSMVCADIVGITYDGKRFWLPKHRQPTLCGLTPANMAVFVEAMPYMANAFLGVTKCFHMNGPPGVPYSVFCGFLEHREKSMACTFNWNFLRTSFAKIDGLLERLEGGMTIVEIGCSSGRTSRELAVHFPKSKILGLDISEEGIEIARKAANDSNINNVEFIVGDFCNLPADWTNKWEFVFALDVIHDVPMTSKAILELWRVIKPGGQAFIMDINLHTSIRDNRNVPSASMMYTISLFHCMTVSLAEGGEGMGNAWGKEKATRMFQDVGFSVQYLYEQGGHIHYLLNKSTPK